MGTRITYGFVKPGGPRDYPDLAKEAAETALADAKLRYSDVQQAYVGYVYGNSTCGQRAIYHSLGMTGIPIFNVNNNCSSGSTALFGARQVIEGGLADCVLALGFEKMESGPLSNKNQFPLHTNPLDHHLEVMGDIYGFDVAPIVPQMFSHAGREHSQRYGTKPEHFAKIAWKNHKHASNNPLVLNHRHYSLQEILDSKPIHGDLTVLQCCPPSDGAAAAVLVSEEFMRRHSLEDRAVEILVQEMVTDTPETFSTRSAMDLVGYKLTEEAARRCFRRTGLSPVDVQVVELHDCFSPNELISYEALGLCPPGQAATLVDKGDNTYGGRWVVNPSGGLIGKGHPLGATGLAQCAELSTQLRGEAGSRQVKDANVALQHNIGLGGAVVVTIYQKYKQQPEVVMSPSNDVNTEEFKSTAVFDSIKEKLKQEGKQLVGKVGAVFAFHVTNGPGGKESRWVVDLKNGSGSVDPVSNDKRSSADCTIIVADSDLPEILMGKMNPQVAFMKGKLKIEGKMAAAFKLQHLRLRTPKARL
uniref:sterol carrier protein 2-like isoform X3 n=1 Tax=Myxine glutinosa TaxID=7769 RepID=UPI00358F1C53